MSDSTTAVIDLAESASKHLRRKAKELSGQLETSYMELAKILFQVCETKSPQPPFDPLYREWGYSTFENYAQEELGLHERKAKHLRRIWYRLEVELDGLDPEIKQRIIRVGWTKVRELIRVLTLQNAPEWVARAESESYSTLCVYIKRYQNALEEAQASSDGAPAEVGLPPKEKFVHKHLAFSESQAEVVNAALEKAALLADSTSDNHLFTMICTDFVATTITGNNADAKIRYLVQLEDKLGLRLIIVDPRTDEVVYGVKTLQRLAEKEE